MTTFDCQTCAAFNIFSKKVIERNITATFEVFLTEPNRQMQLLKSFSIYTAATFINRGMGFILAPILSFYLSEADVGTLSILNTYILLASILLEMGSKAALSVQYFKLDRKDFPDYFNTALIVPWVFFALVLLVAIGFNQFLVGLVEVPAIWVVLIVIMAMSQMLNEQCLNLYRVEDKARSFAIFNIALSLLNFGISLYLIIGLDMDWTGRATGMAISYGVFALISLVIFLRKKLFTFRLNKVFLRHVLLFGIPLIPHRLGAFVIEYSDKVFIQKMLTMEELGVYDYGYKIGMSIQILVMAFSLTFMPFLFESLKNLNWQRKVRVVRISYAFAIGLGVAVLVLSLLSPYIFKYLFDEKFYGGYRFVLWVGLGYLFYGGYNIFANYIHYSGKTYIFSLLAIVNVGLNLVLNYYLIHQYKAMGAAYATVISYFITMLITAFIAQRLYPMPWLAKEVWDLQKIREWVGKW